MRKMNFLEDDRFSEVRKDRTSTDGVPSPRGRPIFLALQRGGLNAYPERRYDWTRKRKDF